MDDSLINVDPILSFNFSTGKCVFHPVFDLFMILNCFPVRMRTLGLILVEITEFTESKIRWDFRPIFRTIFSRFENPLLGIEVDIHSKHCFAHILM